MHEHFPSALHLLFYLILPATMRKLPTSFFSFLLIQCYFLKYFSYCSSVSFVYGCDIFNNVTNKGSEVQKSQVTCESHKKWQVRKAGTVKSRVWQGSKVCDDSWDRKLDTCCPGYRWRGPRLAGLAQGHGAWRAVQGRWFSARAPVSTRKALDGNQWTKKPIYFWEPGLAAKCLPGN